MKELRKREACLPIESYTSEQIAEAILRHNGWLSKVCDELKIHIATLRVEIKRDPVLKDAVDEAEERKIDTAEENLLECVKNKNVDAIKFFLAHKGKSHGYGEGNIGALNVTAVSLKTDAELERIIQLSNAKEK